MKDLENAINIINNKSHNINYQSIYLFTNENLNALNNKINLNNKRIITVCSSGDQYFNFLMQNPLDIVLYDINVLTEYIFYLKKKSIENLEFDEYKDFFINKKLSNKYILSKDIYNKVREDLPDKIKIFWDELYKRYTNKELFKSNLFYKNKYSTKEIINNNEYLKGELEYKLLKEKIKKNKEPVFYNINIFDEFINEKIKFDFIYLSNILDYLSISNIKEYYIKLKQIITKLSNYLTYEGEIGINYIFNYLDELWLKTNHYLIPKVRDEIIYLRKKTLNYRLIDLPSGQNYKSKRIKDKDALLLYRR